MGRNLWVNSTTFSRDFTVLIWDDLLGLFPPRPDHDSLGGWLAEVRRRGAQAPVIYQVWRTRPDGSAESAVAHAWRNGDPLQIEGCYDCLSLSELPEMPELDYEAPQWAGPERFDEVFGGTPLTLQAQPIALFFEHELSLLEEALGEPELEIGFL